LIGKRPYEEKKVLDVPEAEIAAAEEITPVEKPVEKTSPQMRPDADPGIMPLPA